MVHDIIRHHQEKYTCPKRPEVVKDAPGKCPKCGMELIPVKGSKANDDHMDHDVHHAFVKEVFTLPIALGLYLYSNLSRLSF